MDETQRRLKELEDGFQWLLVRQLVHEAKLQALTEELTRALIRAGFPAEPFQKRLRELEGKNARDLLREFGKIPGAGGSADSEHP